MVEDFTEQDRIDLDEIWQTAQEIMTPLNIFRMHSAFPVRNRLRRQMDFALQKQCMIF